MKKPMRTIFFISFLTLFSFQNYGQLTIDLGKDTTFCVGAYSDTMFFGSNVKIENGIEPYSFKWECKIKKGPNSYYYASDLLNDTTSINPYMLYPYPLLANKWWYKFYLTVKDFENNVAKDSVNIRFSQFGYTLNYSVFELEKGDSVLFNDSNVHGGIPPLSYSWTPPTGLTNPNTLITWCKPEIPSEYDIVAIDSCGCISEPNLRYQIRMGISNSAKKQNNGNLSLNIRRIGNLIYFDNKQSEIIKIKVYNAVGYMIYSGSTFSNSFNLSNLHGNKGFFVVNISNDKISNSLKINL